MSAAAEQYVDALAHAHVKGAARALIKTIAVHIPEGHTTTPEISIEDLAAEAHIHEKTGRRVRDALEAGGLIRVVDGGRGKVASYEIMNLDGARPMTPAPLPLIGRARRPKRQRKPADQTPGLFDQTSDKMSDVPTHNVGHFARRFLAYVGHFARRFLAYVGHFARRWWGARRTSDILPDVPLQTSDILPDVAPPLGVPITTRARDQDLKYVEEVDHARARETEDFLDWFAAEYAACHQGARCTIIRAPDGGRIDELLRHGRSVDRLKAMARELWRVTTDGVVRSERWYIAERAPVRNIWLLHRKADFLDLEVTRAQVAPAEAQPPGVYEAQSADNVWTQVLPRIETKVNRSSFHTWFRETVLVADRGDVIEVAKPGERSDIFAEWLAKHYHGLVHEAMAEVRPGTRVHFVVVEEERRKYG